MSFFDTFCEMLVILFAIAMGFLANKLNILGGEVDQKLCKLLLTITVPALTVGSVISGSSLPDTGTILSVLWVAVLFYGLELVIALFAPRLLGGTPKQQGVWRYGLTFSNSAFIGYPVAMALFGQEALFYAVILVLPANMLAYTMGPLMLGGTKRFSWKQLCSPCTIAAALALVLALARVRPPELVGETLNFVGNITIPLSLLVVGSLLAGLPVKQIFASARLWAVLVLRLLVLPVLLCLLLRWLRVDSMVLGIAVILMAMPVAVNGTMLCMEYDGDTEAMAQVTFLTTLASIVTIPLVAMLLL